jgi:hypothetical protein
MVWDVDVRYDPPPTYGTTVGRHLAACQLSWAGKSLLRHPCCDITTVLRSTVTPDFLLRPQIFGGLNKPLEYDTDFFRYGHRFHDG